MIFGHLGIAFLFKSKFYNRSIIFLIICSYLPDILFYIFFGIQWTLLMPYNPIFNGVIRCILNVTGISISFIDDPSMPTHSLFLIILFLLLALFIALIYKHFKAILIYSGIILSHLLFDVLLPDANRGKPIVYPLYPINSTPFELYILDSTIFWLIDLSIFILGFFIILWAFSVKEGRTDTVF